jgi:hypothetical protein
VLLQVRLTVARQARCPFLRRHRAEAIDAKEMAGAAVERHCAPSLTSEPDRLPQRVQVRFLGEHQAGEGAAEQCDCERQLVIGDLERRRVFEVHLARPAVRLSGKQARRGERARQGEELTAGWHGAGR